MSRTHLAIAIATATLALGVGCQRGGETAGTTTVRSGSPGGVRVTSAPDPASDAQSRAAGRLAAALCAQQRACAMGAGASTSSEAALLGEAVCVADVEPLARQNVESWRCAPAVARAGFEECLAAIEAEGRCRDVALTEASEVRACRPSEICRRGAGVGEP